MVTRVCVLVDDPNSTVTRIRLSVPFERMSQDGSIEWSIHSFSDFHPRMVGCYDVFVLQRAASRSAYAAASYLVISGAPYVYEIDDLLTEVPEFLPHQSHYSHRRSQILKMIGWANVVSVSTPVLAARILRHNDRQMIVPNYGTNAKNSALGETESGDVSVTTMIIASSDLLLLDFIAPAMAAVQQQFGDSLRIVAIGPAGPALVARGVRVTALGILSPEEFYNHLAGLRSAFAVMPLDDSVFSSCKSAVKYFDYALASIPCICSDVSPYKDVVHDRETGVLVANTPESWAQAMRDFIERPVEREEVAKRAKERVAERHGLDITVQAWRDAIVKAREPRVVPKRIAAIRLLRLLFHSTFIRPFNTIRSMNHARVRKRRLRRHAA